MFLFLCVITKWRSVPWHNIQNVNICCEKLIFYFNLCFDLAEGLQLAPCSAKTSGVSKGVIQSKSFSPGSSHSLSSCCDQPCVVNVVSCSEMKSVHEPFFSSSKATCLVSHTWIGRRRMFSERLINNHESCPVSLKGAMSSWNDWPNSRLNERTAFTL